MKKLILLAAAGAAATIWLAGCAPVPIEDLYWRANPGWRVANNPCIPPTAHDGVTQPSDIALRARWSHPELPECTFERLPPPPCVSTAYSACTLEEARERARLTLEREAREHANGVYIPPYLDFPMRSRCYDRTVHETFPNDAFQTCLDQARGAYGFLPTPSL